MSKNINFHLVFNDYGHNLPEKSVFFNDEKNEITRLQLRREYRTVSDFLAFKRFKRDYHKFLETQIKTNKKEEVEDEDE